MQERIVVPLDGSEIGESALRHIENLVSKISPDVQTEVILLHIVSPVHPERVPFVGYEVSPDYTEKQMAEIKGKALDYLNQAGENLKTKGVTVTSKVAVGEETAEEIIKYAEVLEANLIAMSTHGRSGLSRWALGSVADKVVRHGGNIPILVIKAPHKS